MINEFEPRIVPPEPQTSDGLWLIFSGYRLLVPLSSDTAMLPKNPMEQGIRISHQVFLGLYRGIPCYAAEGELSGDASFAFQELRALFGRLEDHLYELALTAVHLLEWERNCRYCCKCQGQLDSRTDVRAKECRGCGRLEFPRISPAIIVLIEKEDTLLLARSARFTGEFFSVLAGFVEPGESLEEAVRREVMEETGIAVKNINYFGSQPWPFPDSLMIGFTAQYESGEIRIDGEEIVEAGWYRAGNLPKIPGKLSIARKLIDWFVEKHSSSHGLAQTAFASKDTGKP